MEFSCDDLVSAIAEHLAGRLSRKQLAAWAFDRFYELEQGEIIVPPEEEAVIRDALDDLMFADDAPFVLSEGELRQLMERLAQV
ncbi:MAG: hypothetical protein C0184_07615 [Chloroflexus aggregans]|uniref:Colicin D immunity protein domain-containing protein n=3 Tax=Chloroflexus aggregans TaxID=152260 RepID=B8G470_CHLAD|nr:hypothetical protein [Chloroflexus sp.]ACL23476.1 conserved hypothetical protein [Chloroflexus aggregans DSM 9485]PMP81894.1 MAG: hypothetical protein C0184_07615 [Chloroflexus aggregans]GIW91455.1 MAG: hypothetical protein KatS3mg109_1887 [Pirellulaceae bacterium]GIV89064.1 MAG: hypothetical protein KatS3mg055_1582 [Chloroflexus sp.]GIW91572.1 MAG: hypothetical protein KatS3mg109_2004 [Pirellulaceae bacterium]